MSETVVERFHSFTNYSPKYMVVMQKGTESIHCTWLQQHRKYPCNEGDYTDADPDGLVDEAG